MNGRQVFAVVAGGLASAIAPTSGAAVQDTAVVIRAGAAARPGADTALSRVVAEEAVRRFNAPTTLRMFGRSRIPRGMALEGDVGLLGGPLIIEGVVRGNVVAVNGDVELVAGGEVTGDALIVGGRLLGLAAGRILGEVRTYEGMLPVRRQGEEIALTAEPTRRLRDLNPSTTWRSGNDESYSALTLGTGGTYNRVEGLSIVFGPEIGWRAGGDLQLRVSGYGMLRTAGAVTSGETDLGYTATGEAVLGRRGSTATLGVRAWDLVTPIEAWQLSDNEVGWATFLLHLDYRDYYGAKGVAGFVELDLTSALTARVQVAGTSETSAPTEDPWSILRSSEPWRANPVIDDGHYTSVSLALGYDTRNDERDPTAGWLLEGTWERGASDDVAPRSLPGAVREPPPTDGSYAFHRVSLDFRRYARVSPAGRLHLRVAAGGWLGGDALPVQRRLSIGGPDPLPGYRFRHRACNELVEDPARPALCDRMLLTQVEYRSVLSLRYLDRLLRDVEWLGLESVDVVVFADGGQAWLVGDGPGELPSNRLPSLDTWFGDLGAGIDADGFGLYLAKAFTDGEPLRFLLRLQHRF